MPSSDVWNTRINQALCDHDNIQQDIARHGFVCDCGEFVSMEECIKNAIGPGPWSYGTLMFVARKVMRWEVENV